MRKQKNYRFNNQVPKEHYFNLQYDSKPRWASYWYQINAVLDKKPKSVLEIGVGNKTVSDYLKKLDIDVKTCDFDKNLQPDIIAEVAQLPLKDKSFDLVLCAEVLEHMPFSDFSKALKEIRRVTKKWVVITLPHFSITNFYLGAKLIPFIPKKELSLKIDLPIKHEFLGEHYWEIGKRGYSLDKITKMIKESGFTIEKCFYPLENPKHQFFILKTSR